MACLVSNWYNYHYPNDNKASRVIAGSLLKSWSKNPQFAPDLKAARREWEAKKGIAGKLILKRPFYPPSQLIF
jgi:hypothetical protein